MENQIRQLIGLFSNNGNVSFDFTESWDSVDISTSIILDKIPDSNSFLTNVPLISTRDFWEFKILDEANETILVVHSTSGELSSFDEINAYTESSISLKFIITKNIQDNYLSIYSVNHFNEYISEQSLYAFYNALNNRLTSALIFECVNDHIETFNTESISIVSKDKKIELTGINDRLKRIHLSEGLIHWGAYKLQLLPEDIYPANDTNPFYNIFSKASVCLLMMYLCDHIAITEEVLYLKLCGFKSLNYAIRTTKLSDINIDKKTNEQLFQVYNWCMSGGYIADKFSIARNILSLNLGESEIKLNALIIDAVKSNFRVYEKENVQQYIQMRNEISNLLIDLQSKVNSIAESFTADFKNNLLVLVSFFTSVVVFGVISEASPFVYFSNHIIILSWCFLLISFFYWLYSYNELNKKTKLFHKHYEQIKNRYKTLLDEVELKNVFEECDPDKYDSHNSYIEWQKHKFSMLWLGSIAILFIGLGILFVFNNVSLISLVNKLIISIICCLTNI